jgi:hypothetical protein
VDGVVGNPSNIVTLGGGKPAPNEEPSLDVLKRMKDANEVIEVSDEESEDEVEEVLSAESLIMNGRYTLRF